MTEVSRVRIPGPEAPPPPGRATRHNKGKPQLSLVLEFRQALNAAAKGLEEGVDTYGRGNWRKGMPATEIVDSLARHLTAMMSGERVDPASPNGSTHVAKILTNALMLAELYPDGFDINPDER